jgi:hypothetical protein
MPLELSKYIQDYIRPRKPVTEDINVIYDYFIDLENMMYERFRYKVGMMISIKDRLYKIIKTNDKYSTLVSIKGVIKKYQNKLLNIRRIENKTIFMKRYIRTMNMVQLIWSYLCAGQDSFHERLILKKYKKFWTSYI